MQAVADLLKSLDETRNALYTLQEQCAKLPANELALVPDLAQWLISVRPKFDMQLADAQQQLGYDAVQRNLNALASYQSRFRLRCSDKMPHPDSVHNAWGDIDRPEFANPAAVADAHEALCHQMGLVDAEDWETASRRMTAYANGEIPAELL